MSEQVLIWLKKDIEGTYRWVEDLKVEKFLV